MHYSINLIGSLRLEEKKAEKKREITLAISLICFASLLLAILHSTLCILSMEGTLAIERDKLARVEAEYRRYKATRMTIDKSDIELLDQLQHNRIFWTKKLVAMAQYLPENYWINKFNYERGSFNVEGYGYISGEQEQLITLDDYLNLLRSDTTFSDVFKNTYLNLTKRQDEKIGERVARERITFKYSALGSR